MNHYVQRVCVRVMCKPQLAPLAQQMNPESPTGQTLHPQTTCDTASVAGLAEKVVILNADANLFLKQKGNCQQGIFLFCFSCCKHWFTYICFERPLWGQAELELEDLPCWLAWPEITQTHQYANSSSLMGWTVIEHAHFVKTSRPKRGQKEAPSVAAENFQGRKSRAEEVPARVRAVY